MICWLLRLFGFSPRVDPAQSETIQYFRRETEEAEHGIRMAQKPTWESFGKHREETAESWRRSSQHS